MVYSFKESGITRKCLAARYTYCPDSGELLNRKLNRPVGGQNGKGKGLIVTVHRKVVAVHRVAWYLHTGEDPGRKAVWHRDGDALNNRFSNLRISSAD